MKKLFTIISLTLSVITNAQNTFTAKVMDSKNYEGINWYLKQEKKRIKTITIFSCEQDSLKELDKEQVGVADFIIVTPTNMTKTH